MSIFAPEVLCLIFEATCAPRVPKCWAMECAPADLDLEATMQPYHLVSVCRYWRATGLTFGPMWAYVAVPSGVAHEQAAARFLDHIDVLLTRSGIALLAVDIRAGLRDVVGDDAHRAHRIAHNAFFERVFAGLTRHASRIQILTVSFAYTTRTLYDRDVGLAADALLKALVDLLRCRTPSLTDMRVFTVNSRFADILPSLGTTTTPLLPHAPLLRDLVLSDFPVAHVFPDTGFPSLLRVDFCAGADPLQSETHLLRVLALAPRLQELRLRLVESWDRPPDFISRPRSLPLTRLAMQGPGTHAIMSDVRLPRLASLSVEGGRVSSFRFQASMAETLTTLEVWLDITPSDIGALRQLRALERFVLDNAADDEDSGPDALFDALCDAADPMWPRLRSVALFNRPPVAGSPTGLLRLVQIRNAQGSVVLPLPIEEVTFDELSVPSWEATQLQALLGDRCTCVKNYQY